MNHPSSSTPINYDPVINLSSSAQLASLEVLKNLMNSISALLNKTLDSLTTDSEAKQSLIENISSLSKLLYLSLSSPYTNPCVDSWKIF